MSVDYLTPSEYETREKTVAWNFFEERKCLTLSQYKDRKFPGNQAEWDDRLKTTCTLYVGNLSFFTTEEQIYELFSFCGEVKRVIMGLDRVKRTPCGFCFVEYLCRKDTEMAVRTINGTCLDDRLIRCDFDWGFVEGRQLGRGLSGGQVRDEFREDYDEGRGGLGTRALMTSGRMPPPGGLLLPGHPGVMGPGGLPPTFPMGPAPGFRGGINDGGRGGRGNRGVRGGRGMRGGINNFPPPPPPPHMHFNPRGGPRGGPMGFHMGGPGGLVPGHPMLRGRGRGGYPRGGVDRHHGGNRKRPRPQEIDSRDERRNLNGEGNEGEASTRRGDDVASERDDIEPQAKRAKIEHSEGGDGDQGEVGNPVHREDDGSGLNEDAMSEGVEGNKNDGDQEEMSEVNKESDGNVQETAIEQLDEE